MPTVFVRESSDYRKFHQTKTCAMLTKKPAKGEPRPLLEVDLKDLKFAVPCKYCYPDAPRAKSMHLRCQICYPQRPAPCKHNGGVPVIINVTVKKRTLYLEPGDVITKVRYVWPEKVHHYTTLAS